jgi:menaquinone-dependent protoporphyrinogen IX oxidase
MNTLIVYNCRKGKSKHFGEQIAAYLEEQGATV